jgi:probable phosphoglycerate mutase
MPDTIIDLIRHGEPVGGRLYRGHQIDHALSEKGWQQMWDTVGDCSDWQYIITSPMKRCSEFAQQLAEKISVPVTTENDLREVGFGSWEGRSREQIMTDNLKEYEDFYRDPVNCRPDGAEPLADFINRVTTSWGKILNEYKGQHILIVAHAGVIRAIVAHVLNAEAIGMYHIKVDNAGVSRIINSDHGSVLQFHNIVKMS